MLEQGQRRPGVWVLAAQDDPHTGRPGRQVEQAGDLHDVGVLADVAVGVQGGGHHPPACGSGGLRGTSWSAGCMAAWSRLAHTLRTFP